jgi:ribulose-phosphate 3-epimerase
VENRSLDFDFNLSEANIRIEAHLIVSEPEVWIERLHDQVDTFLVHYESCRNPEGIIKLARHKEKRIGFALNSETTLDAIKLFLPSLNLVLIMMVDPKTPGKPLVEIAAEKVRKLRNILPKMDIEVDGGINPDTIGIVNRAEANKFVSYSYIYASPDPGTTVAKLYKRIESQ